MIIVQTPLRVSFFGGGTDIPSYYLHEGGCVLSSAIDKYIFVSIKTRFDDKIRVGYTETELVDHVDELQHDLIREAIRITGVNHGVEITTMGDIPSAGSGLGSSSTVTVGTLQALYAFQGEHVTAERLAREACQIEIDILGKPIGVQDQMIAAYGGLCFMEFQQDGRVVIEKLTLSRDVKRELASNLMLFYTGITRQADSILHEQKVNIQQRLGILAELKQLARFARDELRAGNVDELGHMLHYSWTLKKRLASGISTGEIDEMYTRARRAGALGGKITGAGGGGFLLLYCTREHQASVRKALKSFRELPFKLERDGAKTIFNYPRSENGTEEFGNRVHQAITIDPQLSEEKGIQPVMSKNGEQNSESSSLLQQYIQDLGHTVSELPLEKIQAAVEVLHSKRMSGHRFFIMGNGGSSSTASHFVCDLNKNTRLKGQPDFKAFSLTDNMPVFSAYANDEGYENVFARQLENDLAPGDVVIAISASGNSENVLRGIEHARKVGAFTIGFTGFDGGQLGSLVDLHINISNNTIEQVEDLHLVLEHMMILTLKQRIKSTASSLIESERPSPVPYKATQKEASVIVQTGEGNTDEGNLPSRGEWIYNLNRSLLRKETDEVLLEQILTSTFNLLKADSGSLLRYDHNGKLTGGYTVYAGKMVRRNADEVSTIGRRGLAKWVFDNHVPTLIENTREDSRWILGQGDAASRSAVSVPLVIEGETVGVLSLARFREKGYTDSHLAFLTAISYLLTNRADPEIDANAGDIKLDELPKAK